MKCARLHLQQRSKVKLKNNPSPRIEKPRRYCQKRLINPQHEEDPRWMDIWDRFHCNLHRDQIQDAPDSARVQKDTEEMVLTVQTLKFQGDVEQTKRPRTSFKYKNITDGKKHRMFVKQIIPENEYSDEDRSSELTYYYFDDYVKYLNNSDKSRPTSGKSSILLKSVPLNLTQNKSVTVNKATQIENLQIDDSKKKESKVKRLPKQYLQKNVKEEDKNVASVNENPKIIYHNTGKRKSLIISRAQSPETVQVIRVDVVCNHPSTSTLSETEKTKKLEGSAERPTPKFENVPERNHFTNKYLLTNSVKTLDESLYGGSKVTLLCKTFRLSDRLSKQYDKPYVEKNRKHPQVFKDYINNEIKVKNRK